MANYMPGQEPAELQKYLNPLLKELHAQYPDDLVDMSTWNHSRWDKVAGYLTQKLGYPNGTAFLNAYGFDIYNPNQKEKPIQEIPSRNAAEPERKQRMSFCPNCGAPLDSVHKFCPSCGASLADFGKSSSDNNRDILPANIAQKESGIGHLVVERAGSTYSRYDNLAISIDGKTLAQIAQGKTMTFNVPAGTHSLGFLLENGIYCEDELTCNIHQNMIQQHKAA